MPRYYFNLVDRSRVTADREGADLPDAAAARECARSIAQDLVAEMDRGWSSWRVEVRDERGRCVLALPCSEVAQGGENAPRATRLWAA